MADQEREFYLRTIETLNDALRQDREMLRHQDELLTQQTELIAELKKKIEELTEALNAKKVKKDSHNSSKPPSSDGYSKPAPKSLRTKSDKKQGAQKGHAGKGMPIMRKPDEVRNYYPEQCKNCPHKADCNFSCLGTHYTYDIEVITKLVAHKAYKCNCPMDSKELSGQFPADATASKQYGKGLRAFVVSLLTQGYVSVSRTKQLIEGLGIPICTGTIQNMLTDAAEKVSDAVEIIRRKVSELRVVHCDETGADINGSLYWIHCICNALWSYCVIHKKRGSIAMDEIGILPMLKNCIAIHDFWKSYLKYNNIKHGFCNTHLARELIYVYEQTGQEWANQMNSLLSEMCGRRNELLKAGVYCFEAGELEDYFRRYDEYLDEGTKLNPILPKAKGKKGPVSRGTNRCLIDRMKDYKDDILRFATDWEVPFTNNEAERCVRFAKVKEKVSGCFRTKAGADNFISIMSYIGSAKKHGESVFKALLKAFEGEAAALVESWG